MARDNPHTPRKGIGLRALLLGFVLLVALTTFGICLLVAYTVQRDALIDSALASNRAYASKVASSIGEFLRSAQDRLNFSSQVAGRHFDDLSVLQQEVTRMQVQDSELNAVMVVDAQGKVLASYPQIAGLIGSTLPTQQVSQALGERRPLVSPVYTTAAGSLSVFISRPVLGPTGEFLGLIGGSIYIQQSGVMHTLTSSHFHNDGTYAFIADSNRRLLYHDDQKRIGEVLPAIPTVDAALNGQAGRLAAENYRGIPMLAGFAPVRAAGWAVVAQQPEEMALAPLQRLMREMLLKILPAGVLGLALILVITLLITRPLRQLAEIATTLSAPHTGEHLQAVRTWYAEATAIRRALLSGVQALQQHLGQLNRVAQSDPLTGLANRRAMEAALTEFEGSHRHYAALALDIDHFKRVNDTFGHDAGDRALQEIAAIIQGSSRQHDLACRAGGEEFVLLLPDTSLAVASEVAERIRQTIEATVIEGIGSLTISIGVACRDDRANSAAQILKLADKRLYQAKQAGRNRVVATDPADSESP